MATEFYKSLTPQQKTDLKANVKRANERLRDIEKTFGNKSYIYNNWIKDIKRTSGFNEESFLNGAKNLIRATEITESDVVILNNLFKKNTRAMQMNRNIEELSMQPQFKGMSRKELENEAKTYEEQKQDLHEIIKNNADAIYNWSTSITDALHEGWDRPLTYEEMQDLLHGYNSKWEWHRKYDENWFKE